jgi:ATP-binding cassette subfamily F protein uup
MAAFKKISFKEKQELKELPEIIEATEEKIAGLQSDLADPEFYKVGEKVKEAQQQLGELEEQLMTLLERWEELEQKELQS